MKKTYLVSICLMVLGLTRTLDAQIQESDWGNTAKLNASVDAELQELYTEYRYASISVHLFKQKMKKASQEISIPTPDGGFDVFELQPVQVVADEVKHLYTIKTFRGIKKGDPSTVISCDISDGGFHASVYGNDESYYVQPIDHHKPSQMVVYYNKNRKSTGHTCNTSDFGKNIADVGFAKSLAPDQKSTFRLAIAATGEYSRDFGGSPYSSTNVLNALAAGVNMINPIYLRDIGVDFTLVTNTALIYDDPATDPFNLNDQEDVNLKSHQACEGALGVNGFDIGHTVATEGGGGLAGFAVVCKDDEKGEGMSDASDNLTELWIDYVCHELGHQFGAEHNFSSKECEQSSAMHQFEPGEGSSLMCYVGLCGIGYTTSTDPFFHQNSINSMKTTIANTSCAVTTATGNASAPVPDAKSDMTIPKQTPFLLVGSATDANDAAANITYSWQQWEGAGGETTGSPNCAMLAQPLFRSRAPISEAYRAFPQYSDVLAGNNDQQWEKLPCAAGAITFSLAVRDNNTSFGRTGQDLTELTVANTGPFEVSSPNGGESLNGGDMETITWTVNGTDAHCPMVDVLLSTDGGTTYTVIADAVANDGSESIEIPNTASTSARMIVRCNVAGGYRAASTFYDVSNASFSIVEGNTSSVYQVENVDISIYPNPVSNKVFIDLKQSEQFVYRLTDINGRLLQEQEMRNSVEVDVAKLPSGLYYLQLTHSSTGNNITEKIIVQH